MIDINKFIKIEEIKHGLTQAEVARRMGTSPQALSAKIMRGTMQIKDLELLANAMNCDLKIEFVDYK